MNGKEIIRKKAPKLLFSTNTLLSYYIAEKYYNGVYFAWFAISFDMGNKQPASSNPITICRDIIDAVATNDQNCEKLDRIRNGILRGAQQKKEKRNNIQKRRIGNPKACC